MKACAGRDCLLHPSSTISTCPIAERYKNWDKELNEIYGVLKEQMDKLIEEQRNWVKQRDEASKEASLKYKGG